MTRRSSAPSARLLRAVAAERGDLERRREELLDRRRRLQAELDEIEASMAELDERLMLIGRLAGDDRHGEQPRIDGEQDVSETDAHDHAARPGDPRRGGEGPPRASAPA